MTKLSTRAVTQEVWCACLFQVGQGGENSPASRPLALPPTGFTSRSEDTPVLGQLRQLELDPSPFLIQSKWLVLCVGLKQWGRNGRGWGWGLSGEGIQLLSQGRHGR